jgi:hypothetical protein
VQNRKMNFIGSFAKIFLNSFATSFFRSAKFLVFLFLLQTKAVLASQQIEAILRLFASQTISVEIKSEKTDVFWEFLTSYADRSDLEKRIENLKFFDENGDSVSYQKIGAGKFVADKPVRHLRYDVKVTPADDFAGIAHVSWINQPYGLLVLADLIPRNFETASAKLFLSCPSGWRILSNDDGEAVKNLSCDGENFSAEHKAYFVVERIEKAIFLICQEFRERNFSVGKTAVRFVFVGDWGFVEQASQLAKKIFIEYTDKLGRLLFPKINIFLLPFPEQPRFNYWQAETKGATVTIVSAPAVFKSNALNLLSQQLRHEILHLWIPNSLALRGNYDWFFEGFVIYQSLKSGVFMGEIRFEDFLSHIATAFDSVQSQSFPETSLIELSRNRWQTSKQKLLYAKGLLVAFLFDTSILKARKNGIEIIFRELLREFSNRSEDANKAVLKILRKYNENLVNRYIEGAMPVNLQYHIVDFGIQIKKTSGKTRFELTENLSARQKDLLEKLGYNQWRKVAVRAKS